MEQTIQFESTIESGIIRIPDKYVKSVPPAVIVTIAPAKSSKVKIASKSKAGALSQSSFSAVRIDTSGWKWNREEANERR